MSNKKPSETTPNEGRAGADGVPQSDGLNRRGLLRMAAASAGLAAVGGTVLTACGGGEDATTVDGRKEPLAGPKGKFEAPGVTCFMTTENTIELQVCAGATGAPAGFSVQWMTCAALAANNNVWFASDDTRLCKASFSGNANASNWNLGAGTCVNVVIGGLNDADPGVSFTCNEPLTCDTCYVFRAFAHATSAKNRSDFTANRECTTSACKPTGFVDGDFCTRSQGFYSSGNASRDQMIACYGGDPTGAACTSAVNVALVTIGGGIFTYTWSTTGTCVDVQPGPGVFFMDSGLANLRSAIGGGGGSSFFTANGTNATSMGTGGGLASQAAALTLNIAASGATCTGSPAGYGAAVLCKFVAGDTFKNDGSPISAATAAALNSQTVSQVLAAANAYLGGNGTVALPYGLASAADLNELVANLNLAFDGKDWDGDGTDDHDCGGMTAFAESHLCKP